MSARTRTLVVVAAVVLALDGVTKWLTVTRLADRPVDLGWVVLRSARNTGISFSLGADQPAWVVLALTTAATVAILVLALRGDLRPTVAAGLLVGGGLGNLLDRLGDGAVVDMVDLGWFPVFNVADVALNVGVGLVLLHGLRHGDHHDEADHDEAEAAPPGDDAALRDDARP